MYKAIQFKPVNTIENTGMQWLEVSGSSEVIKSNLGKTGLLLSLGFFLSSCFEKFKADF